ncbi:primase-helicase family protein [Rhodopseudomonas sp. RCAM05734]|uniref:primase-helicase family protein n=1 Tax=Rhodopseudomonas sp. RCAM05734 TaxID=3457549 RepID=UPI004044E279
MQKPRERIGTALVLRGSRGSGKSKVGEVIGSLIAAHYFPVDDPRYIAGQFNSHSASCLFLHADEAVWAGDKHAEGRLKSLITSAVQMIEAKGVDPIRMPNYTHVLMTSNEYWVVPAGEDERRFCVLDVGSHCAQNNEYFRQMDEQLDTGGRERLLFELQTFDLASVNLWKIPQTKALLDQKLQSLDSINDFWFNRLHDGLLVSEDDSWREQVIKADFYSAYLKDSARIGIGRKRGEAEFWKRMLKLAPGLGDKALPGHAPPLALDRGQRAVHLDRHAGVLAGILQHVAEGFIVPMLFPRLFHLGLGVGRLRGDRHHAALAATAGRQHVLDFALENHRRAALAFPSERDRDRIIFRRHRDPAAVVIQLDRRGVGVQAGRVRHRNFSDERIKAGTDRRAADRYRKHCFAAHALIPQRDDGQGVDSARRRHLDFDQRADRQDRAEGGEARIDV